MMMMIEHIWNLTLARTTNVVAVYVNYLRRKINHSHSQKLIHTVRGLGYELRGPSCRCADPLLCRHSQIGCHQG